MQLELQRDGRIMGGKLASGHPPRITGILDVGLQAHATIQSSWFCLFSLVLGDFVHAIRTSTVKWRNIGSAG